MDRRRQSSCKLKFQRRLSAQDQQSDMPATAVNTLPVDAPETSAAAKWLAEGVHPADGARLATCIAEVLAERYSGHWYVEEPHRGSGFRSLSCATHTGLDRLLLKAAERAGMESKKLHMALAARGVQTVWVNPGEVKALVKTARNGGETTCIFSDGSRSDNPYEKPRLKIQPTRVQIGMDGQSRSPSPTDSTGSESSFSSVPTGAAGAALIAPPGLAALPRAVTAC